MKNICSEFVSKLDIIYDSKLLEKNDHALKIIKLQDVQMLILCARMYQNAT